MLTAVFQTKRPADFTKKLLAASEKGLCRTGRSSRPAATAQTTVGRLITVTSRATPPRRLITETRRHEKTRLGRKAAPALFISPKAATLEAEGFAETAVRPPEDASTAGKVSVCLPPSTTATRRAEAFATVLAAPQRRRRAGLAEPLAFATG